MGRNKKIKNSLPVKWEGTRKEAETNKSKASKGTINNVGNMK